MMFTSVFGVDNISEPLVVFSLFKPQDICMGPLLVVHVLDQSFQRHTDCLTVLLYSAKELKLVYRDSLRL